MGTIVDMDGLRKKKEDQRIRLLIDRKFGTHEDYGIIMNMVGEYGPEMMANIIRSNPDYEDPTFAL
jgi:hypothetical protein